MCRWDCACGYRVAHNHLSPDVCSWVRAGSSRVARYRSKTPAGRRVLMYCVQKCFVCSFLNFVEIVGLSLGLDLSQTHDTPFFRNILRYIYENLGPTKFCSNGNNTRREVEQPPRRTKKTGPDLSSPERGNFFWKSLIRSDSWSKTCEHTHHLNNVFGSSCCFPFQNVPEIMMAEH